MVGALRKAQARVYEDATTCDAALERAIDASLQLTRDVRDDVEPETVARLALAIVIGAQTMNDLGLALDAGELAGAVERLLRR